MDNRCPDTDIPKMITTATIKLLYHTVQVGLPPDLESSNLEEEDSEEGLGENDLNSQTEPQVQLNTDSQIWKIS